MANELETQGVYSSGILITEGWIVEQVVRALLYVFPVGVMLEVLLLYLLFRSVYAVAVTLGICVLQSCAVWDSQRLSLERSLYWSRRRRC